MLARAELTWLIAESSVEIAADAAVCVEMSIDPVELDEMEVTPVRALESRRYLFCTAAPEEAALAALGEAARFRAVRNLLAVPPSVELVMVLNLASAPTAVSVKMPED
ncbi:MAG: hypothetical protein EB033_15340 [Proteobacteria bacterium]|nr:hypothetical protein [Pseudomonadota bacterium]